MTRRAALLMPIALLLPAQTPALVCPSPSHGFGRLIQGVTVSHTFQIENRGARTLHIQDVKVSCACTTAPLTAHEIAPGASLLLPVTFDTRTFEGPVEKSIAVLTDDPVRPVLLLELRAHIVRPYQIEPATLKFPAHSRNARLTLPLRLTAAEGTLPPAAAATVEGSTAFTVESHLQRETRTREFLVELLPGMEAQAIRATLVLVMDDASRTRLEVPIQGELVEDLSHYPTRLDLGNVRPGADLGKRLQVILHHPDVELRGIQADVPWLQATLAPRATLDLGGKDKLSAARGFSVSLKVDPQAPAGPQALRLTLSTTSPKQPSVQIPCTLVIQ